MHNNFVNNLNCADNLNYAVSWNCADIVAFNNCFLIYHPLHLEEVTSLLKKMRLIMSSPLIDIIIIIWLNYDYSIMSSPFMSLRIEYMASFSWLSFWPLIDLKNRLIFFFSFQFNYTCLSPRQRWHAWALMASSQAQKSEQNGHQQPLQNFHINFQFFWSVPASKAKCLHLYLIFLIVPLHIIADHQSVRLIPHQSIIIVVGLIFEDASCIVGRQLGLQGDPLRFCIVQ